MDANGFAFQLNPNSRTARTAEEFTRRWIAEKTDPASGAPGAPPLYGHSAIPHVATFQSLIGTYSRAYLNPDEAIRDSIENAHLMRKDVGILECVEGRRRLTALLDWEIVPENDNDPYQGAVAKSLTGMVQRIRRFTEYRFWLMDAIWVGRAAIQHRFGYVSVNGRQRMIPKPLHQDHPGWMPINGDKLVFRYEDERKQKAGSYAHQLGIRVGIGRAAESPRPDSGKQEFEQVGDGTARFLKPWERDTLIVHKHFIEDADYHHAHFAGSVHGVGIRSRIYWEWYLKQEAFAFLMQYLERSAGGIEVWTYPMSDNDALKKVQKAASERMANGRNIVYFPRPAGEDSAMYDFQVVEPGAVGLDIIRDIVDDYFGGRIKRYILGQRLSTEAAATGLGSGVAEAHMDTLHQIVSYDARNLEETIGEELVRYLQRINYPETLGWHMRFRLKTDADDMAERLEGMAMAYEMGARIPESEVLKSLGIGEAKPGDFILKKEEPIPVGPGALGGNPGGPSDGMPGMPDGGPGGDDIFSLDLEQEDSGRDFYSRSFDAAASLTDTNPTESQKKSGNYRKGKATWKGLRFSIENPRGSIRSGKSRDGKEWSSKMSCHYGYILGTVGNDRDHVDCFVGKHTESDLCFIVNQNSPDGKFDEHKCMIGFLNEDDAKAEYLKNYDKNWKGLESIVAMPIGQFRSWIDTADKKKPVSFECSFVGV